MSDSPAVCAALRLTAHSSARRRNSHRRRCTLIHELDGIPLYNGDVEDAGAPPNVVQLRDAVRKSDGLLIATTEYNHGVPGVLKNTIDWLSRPPRTSALNGKVAALMGASPGMTGTARGQSQLRPGRPPAQTRSGSNGIQEVAGSIPASSTGKSLGLAPLLDPPSKEGDPVRWPRPIARHRPGGDLLENGIGVIAHVVVAR